MLKVIPMKTKKAIPGFTLIELIIVLAIIAILAAVVVPGIGGYIRDNRIEEANNNALLLARGAQTWLNEMEADSKPIDAYNQTPGTSEANLFKTTFATGSFITLVSTNTAGTTNSYIFNATSTIPSGWVKRDGTTPAVSTPVLTNVDLTKYLAGLKPSKSGTDLGSCYICIDLSTKTIRYAAWTSEDNCTAVSYFSGGYTHTITRANQENKVISDTNHAIVGFYPMSDEL